MRSLNLAKKLKPARKAWKSFTIKVKSKLDNLHVPSSIKDATHRLLQFCSFHLFAPFKKRFLSKHPAGPNRHLRRYSYDHHRYYYPYQHYQSQLKNHRKVVYIDQLYAEPVSMQAKQMEPKAETSRRNHHEVADDKVSRTKGKEIVAEESGVYSIEEAWKAVVAKSPHLRGVDERADEFIYKFHEDRKLEKEKSDLDFQEMLARSA